MIFPLLSTLPAVGVLCHHSLRAHGAHCSLPPCDTAWHPLLQVRSILGSALLGCTPSPCSLCREYYHLASLLVDRGQPQSSLKAKLKSSLLQEASLSTTHLPCFLTLPVTSAGHCAMAPLVSASLPCSQFHLPKGLAVSPRAQSPHWHSACPQPRFLPPRLPASKTT